MIPTKWGVCVCTHVCVTKVDGADCGADPLYFWSCFPCQVDCTAAVAPIGCEANCSWASNGGVWSNLALMLLLTIVLIKSSMQRVTMSNNDISIPWFRHICMVKDNITSTGFYALGCCKHSLAYIMQWSTEAYIILATIYGLLLKI